MTDVIKLVKTDRSMSVGSTYLSGKEAGKICFIEKDVSGIQASLFFLFLPTLDIANKYFLVMCFPISKMIITTVDK